MMTCKAKDAHSSKVLGIDLPNGNLLKSDMASPYRLLLLFSPTFSFGWANKSLNHERTIASASLGKKLYII